MAKRPRIYYNGVNVETFQFNGQEVFEAEYRSNLTGNVHAYHKHKGLPNQTSANGCYQKKILYGGSCGGHTYTYTTVWSCGYCGTKVSSTSMPSGCPNNACANHGDNNGGAGTWYPHESATGTNFCSNPSTCNNWKWQTRYDLGCGYEEE